MKTQLYGCYHPPLRYLWISRPIPYMRPRQAFMWLIIPARLEFKDSRINGDEKLDALAAWEERYPAETSITWVKGEKKSDGYVYGVKECDGFYHYECRYDADSADLEWMRQTDCNYLKRILRDGTLQKLEPDVYYLLLNDHEAKSAPKVLSSGPIDLDFDIGKWWRTKVDLKDIAVLLANAEKEYKKSHPQTGVTVQPSVPLVVSSQPKSEQELQDRKAKETAEKAAKEQQLNRATALEQKVSTQLPPKVTQVVSVVSSQTNGKSEQASAKATSDSSATKKEAQVTPKPVLKLQSEQIAEAKSQTTSSAKVQPENAKVELKTDKLEQLLGQSQTSSANSALSSSSSSSVTAGAGFLASATSSSVSAATSSFVASTQVQVAADQGLANAQYALGVRYDTGKGVAKDEKEAVRLYRLAADQGHAKAQFNLGVHYHYTTGTGVAKDEKEAVRFYLLAADQGYANAQFNLGICYDKGIGFAKDEKEAVRFYRLAADQGFAAAQCTLGVCYEYGTGVEKDEKEAVRLYRLAADQGDANAQFNLGDCYETGRGVSKDLDEAIRFYTLAASQGNQDAQAALNRIQTEAKTHDASTVKTQAEAIKLEAKTVAESKEQVANNQDSKQSPQLEEKQMVQATKESVAELKQSKETEIKPENREEELKPTTEAQQSISALSPEIQKQLQNLSDLEQQIKKQLNDAKKTNDSLEAQSKMLEQRSKLLQEQYEVLEKRYRVFADEHKKLEQEYNDHISAQELEIDELKHEVKKQADSQVQNSTDETAQLDRLLSKVEKNVTTIVEKNVEKLLEKHKTALDLYAVELKSQNQEQLQESKKALVEQIAAERQKLSASGGNKGEMNGLEQKLAGLEKLLAEYQQRQEMLKQLEYIHKSDRLKRFYYRFQARLNQLFLAEMVIASGKVQQSNSIVIQMLGQVINIATVGLGSLISAGVTGLANLISAKDAQQASNGFIISISGAEQVVESAARILIDRYEDQIKKLTLPGAQGILSKVSLTAKANGGVEMLADMAVARIIDSVLKKHKSNKNTQAEVLVDFVFHSQNQSGLFSRDASLDNDFKIDWTDKGVFRNSGIRVFNPETTAISYYDGKDVCHQANKYYYRWGTDKEVEELHLNKNNQYKGDSQDRPISARFVTKLIAEQKAKIEGVKANQKQATSPYTATQSVAVSTSATASSSGITFFGSAGSLAVTSATTTVQSAPTALESKVSKEEQQSIDANTLYCRGKDEFELGKYDEALECFKRFSVLQPNSVVGLNALGLTSRQLKQPDAELAYFKQAYELCPNNLDTLYGLMHLHYHHESYKEALRYCEEALKLQPQDPIILNNRGLIHQGRKDYAAALADFNQSLSIKNDAAVRKDRDALVEQISRAQVGVRI